MSFQEIRRQPFLNEQYAHHQLVQFDAVLNDPDGLIQNLGKPERERGWHASLASGIGFEMFNRLMLRYTAGDPCANLRSELDGVVAAYERYGVLLWKDSQDRNEPVLDFDSLDAYCQLLQLIGLCFLLHRRDLLPRLASLQDGVDGAGNAGRDTLYEEFMANAMGPENRFETDWLCQPRPYEYLFNALTETTTQGRLNELNLFLKHWYRDLAGTGWHDSHKPDEQGNQSGYYGYWSFEAGAAVLLLGIEDDSSLHKYLYYPKDMVAWARAHDVARQPLDDRRLSVPGGQPCPRAGWWFTPAAAGSRRRFAQGEVMPIIEGSPWGGTFWQWDAVQD